MARRRAAVLIGVYVLFIGHLIQWKLTGLTLSPVEPSVSMYTLEHGMVNAGFIFFTLALLATLIFGRFLCGWGCHLVALQDLCGWMMKKIGVRPKPFRSRLLVYVPLILGLYMFVWPTFKRLALAPALHAMGMEGVVRFIGAPTPFPGFSNHLLTENLWANFASLPVAIPFLLICGFATVYFLGAKGFCTYGCPYGGLFAPLEQLAPGRIIVDPDKCHQCGHCTAVCTSNVRVHEQVREFGMVTDPGCMKCMDCVSVCPNNALSFGFARPAAFKRKPKHAPIRRNYDLTWPEEIALALVFLASFIAWRSVYGLIPMLMAVGVSGCVTFLAWKAWRVVHDRDARIIGAQLTRAGRIKPAGGAFLALVALALLVTAHSLVIQIERMRGDADDARVLVSRAAAFTQEPGAVPEKMRALAGAGLAHYRRASGWRHGGWGVTDTPEADTRAAWLHTVRGERAEAIALLRRLDDRLGYADARAVDMATLLAYAGREDDAVAYLGRVLDDRPRLTQTRDLLVSVLLGRGDLDGALRVRRGAIDPDDPIDLRQAKSRASLAALLLRAGRSDEAFAELRRASVLAPKDATIRNDLAVALYLSGAREQAVAEMRAAAELDASNPARWRTLGQMLDELGQADEARAALSRAASLESTDKK